MKRIVVFILAIAIISGFSARIQTAEAGYKEYLICMISELDKYLSWGDSLFLEADSADRLYRHATGTCSVHFLY